VAALAASIAVVSEARLHRLFASSFPQVEVLDVETATRRLDEFEVVLPIGSLGRLFRNTPADFPGRPYLSPSEAARAAWAERLGPRQGRMRIGLSWRGGAAATGRTRRSVELPQLAAALRAPDRELVSLQYGEVAEEVAAAAAASGASIRCFAKSEIDDFDDLAALVLNLDAVVSVQTALVHVCGAVGARCLAMVPFAPEWRYGQSGESMPWYGSVKILRQAEAGVWEPVLEKVGAELRRL
jgi:ADP-heptose:LPS heptosyltransferase